MNTWSDHRDRALGHLDQAVLLGLAHGVHLPLVSEAARSLGRARARYRMAEDAVGSTLHMRWYTADLVADQLRQGRAEELERVSQAGAGHAGRCDPMTRSQQQPAAAQLRIKVGDRIVVIQDDGSPVFGTCRTAPWEAASGDWMLKYEGRTGGYLLTRCWPRPAEQVGRLQAVALAAARVWDTCSTQGSVQYDSSEVDAMAGALNRLDEGSKGRAPITMTVHDVGTMTVGDDMNPDRKAFLADLDAVARRVSADHPGARVGLAASVIDNDWGIYLDGPACMAGHSHADLQLASAAYDVLGMCGDGGEPA